MDRKKFLKKGLLGGTFLVSAKSFSGLVNNTVNDELKPLDIIGFNHIKNSNSKIMENTVLHKADTRGHANHGWLNSYHSFSFANYYNPERMHFGVLRVLNDDTVSPGMGFGTHPHENMEIISIPLEGDLEHKDSMNNTQIIKHGDIQVMSAGTGIYHSEFNRNKNKEVKFLQIWIMPNKKNVTPRYDQITLNLKDRENQLQQIVSPNPDDDGVWIHQDAWFHLGKFTENKNLTYSPKRKGNGVYLFVLNGEASVNNITVQKRDGIGVWNTETISISTSGNNTEILIMDVPMSL